MDKRITSLKQNHFAKLESIESEFNKAKLKLEKEFQNRIDLLKEDYKNKVNIEKTLFAIQIAELNKVIEGERKGDISKKNSIKNGESFWQVNFYKALVVSVVLLLFGVVILILVELKPSKTELNIKIGEIETTLRVGYDNDYFRTTKLPTNEKVKNLVGDYYKIDLKFADTKELILFPAGKYYMPIDKNELLNSITRFREKVYKALDQKYETEIFIKGTADIKGNLEFSDTLIDRLNDDDGFSKIDILPLDKVVDKYDTISVKYGIDKVYRNKDLPNLRARFIQKLITEGNSDWETPKILEGTVSGEESERERNAYLIMFVNRLEKVVPDAPKKQTSLKILSFGLIGLALSILLYSLYNKNRR